MKLHLYQVAVMLVSGFMIFQGFRNFLKAGRGQTYLKLFTRIVVWGGMATIALFPKFTYVIAESIGMVGNINAVILTGFILTFLMIFKLLSAIERLEQQITEITRERAIRQMDNEK